MPFPFLSLRDNLPPAHTHTHTHSRILSHSAGNRYGLLLMLLLLTGHSSFSLKVATTTTTTTAGHQLLGTKRRKKMKKVELLPFCAAVRSAISSAAHYWPLFLSLSLTSTTPNRKKRGRKSKERVIVFVMSTALITVPASSAAVVLVTNELSSLSQLLLSYKTITIHTHWKKERGLSIYSIIFGNATTTTFALHQWPPVSASNESFSVLLLLLLLCLSFGDINCNHTSCTQALFGGA